MENKPVSGVRILEVGSYIAAPYASSLLCSLGAEVVKIEPLRGGDPFRRGQGVDSPYFAQYNAGKKSLAVDLKNPAGADLVRSLLGRFDVLLENLRPGKMAALGLGADRCRAENPNLVYASVSGFGSDGPLAGRPAYDTIGQSLGGLYSIMNAPDAPGLTGTCLADLITGVVTATGILAALVGRANGGTGMAIETSMLECVSALTIDAMTQMNETGSPPTRGSRFPQAQNFCLRTASDRSLTVHLSSSEKFWTRFALLLGREDLLHDSRFRSYTDRVGNYDELRTIFQSEFAARTCEEWEKMLIDADIPCAPVLDMAQVAAHPQTEWLGLLEHRPAGETLVRAPWRISGERPDRAVATPRTGQHSREIACEVYDADEVDRLIRVGVLLDTSSEDQGEA